ncbi:MAG: hypothetical protein GY777_29710 [Candidatus Brocadiaceae bacterium]|nr:hypothetical protein [Candidatus Brocadiaceae bacterium]
MIVGGESELSVIDSMGITVPVMYDKYKIISRQFGYTGELPYTIYINKDGVIRNVKTGFSSDDMTEITEIVSSLKN